MFDLRLKRIQVAIADGRLDEACELMRDPSLRAHRTGQKLLTRLVKAYVKRGQEHLAAGRIASALDDCNRAEKLAGNMPAVMDLRSAVCKEMETNRLAAQQQAQQLERGRQQLQNGWLSAGQKILSGSDDKHAQMLLDDARFHLTAMEESLKRIQKALDSGDFELAGRIYHEQGLARTLNEQAGGMLRKIQARADRQIREHLDEGHLQQAGAILSRLPACVLDCPELQGARQGLACCRQAADFIETGSFLEASLYMKKAQTLLPKAKWIREGLQQVQKAAQVQTDLQAGPLGLLENTGIYPLEMAEKAAPMQYNSPGQNPMKAPLMTMEPKKQGLSGFPQMFVLQLDGIGAYLVHRADHVTAGPVSSSARPDIGFIAAPDSGVKQIERLDGDYFACDYHRGPQTASGGRHLLSEGDKIEISPRCRMKFSRPNPASGTACLILSSARLPRADVQQVILMDREILIGPGRNCHVQTGQLSETLTLFVQDGRLLCRENGGGPVNECKGIGINQRVEIGTVGLMVIPYPGD